MPWKDGEPGFGRRHCPTNDVTDRPVDKGMFTEKRLVNKSVMVPAAGSCGWALPTNSMPGPGKLSRN